MARTPKPTTLARRPLAQRAVKRVSAIRNRKARVRIARLAHAKGLPLPAYQSAAAAGLDLVAALPADQPVKLAPRARVLVPTGLVIELPVGFEGQVRPRSGLALRHGVTVLNSPGTIDADYRGEVQVILVNLGDTAFTIARGERIAQLVIAPVVQAELVETTVVSKTARGAGGFGSTGKTTPATKAKQAPRRKEKQSSARPASAAKRKSAKTR